MINQSEKAEFRKLAKEIRQKIDMKKISFVISDKLLNNEVYKSSKTIMSYYAKDLEVSINNFLANDKKSWFLPALKYSTDLNEDFIVAVPYYYNKTKMIKGKFDIYEPEIKDEDFYKQIHLDLIIVPGLCFDKHGNRIGFGKGFYDRFLKLNPKSFKIGLCPKDCLVDNLPVDKWDCKVDLVLTE